MAADWGVAFRFDGAILPSLPGETEQAGASNDQTPIDYRVSPEQVVAMEMADPERKKRWVASYDKVRAMPASDRLYTCGAGATSFYVDPQGTVSPCLLTAKYRYTLAQSSFLTRWN